MTDNIDQDDPAQADRIVCNPSLQDLYSYIDGQLDDSQQVRFQTHLKACGGCDDIVLFHRQLRTVIGSRCREELPPEVRRRVIDSITELF